MRKKHKTQTLYKGEYITHFVFMPPRNSANFWRTLSRFAIKSFWSPWAKGKCDHLQTPFKVCRVGQNWFFKDKGVEFCNLRAWLLTAPLLPKPDPGPSFFPPCSSPLGPLPGQLGVAVATTGSFLVSSVSSGVVADLEVVGGSTTLADAVGLSLSSESSSLSSSCSLLSVDSSQASSSASTVAW